jgi:RNA polymerase sigma factor (sigma-70 family)
MDAHPDTTTTGPGRQAMIGSGAVGSRAMNEEHGNAGAPPPSPPSLDSTFELLRRARTGDQNALDRLFARHLAPLKRWASGRLPRGVRDLADTDDLVQDTLLRTFKSMEGFEPRRVGALQAYLRQAVLNRVRDEFRHKRRRPDQTGLDDVVVEGGESPLEEAIGRQAVESYEQALARLRPEEREAIIGRVELGMSYADLADALGKPTTEAARKAAKRALFRLAKEMKVDGGR